MIIKRRIQNHKSDVERGHAYQGPLSGFVKVFTRDSEWNERCVIEKISQKCTSSRLTSIARYGFQELQNSSEHSNAQGMKKPSFEQYEEFRKNYTERSNTITGHNRLFERCEENQEFKPWRSNNKIAK